MAFFDNMKSKLTATSQTAVQKARELTEIARLNAQVSEAENQINELYRRLGHEIYQAYREAPLSVGTELIGRINELHDDIADCKAQIQVLNQANLCPNCGARINKGMLFCSSCGAKLPAPESKQARLCSGCGEVLEDGALFCTACGTKAE